MAFARTRPGSAALLYGNCSSSPTNPPMISSPKCNKKHNVLLSRLTNHFRSHLMVCAPPSDNTFCNTTSETLQTFRNGPESQNHPKRIPRTLNALSVCCQQ